MKYFILALCLIGCEPQMFDEKENGKYLYFRDGIWLERVDKPKKEKPVKLTLTPEQIKEAVATYVNDCKLFASIKINPEHVNVTTQGVSIDVDKAKITP